MKRGFRTMAAAALLAFSGALACEELSLERSATEAADMAIKAYFGDGGGIQTAIAGSAACHTTTTENVYDYGAAFCLSFDTAIMNWLSVDSPESLESGYFSTSSFIKRASKYLALYSSQDAKAELARIFYYVDVRQKQQQKEALKVNGRS